MKKVSTLIIIVLSIVLIFVFGYVGYGSTMINIENEKSIINHLSSNKNNPINILATQNTETVFWLYIPILSKQKRTSIVLIFPVSQSISFIKTDINIKAEQRENKLK